MLNLKKCPLLAVIVAFLFIPYAYSMEEKNGITRETKEEKIAEVMSLLLANGFTPEDATDLVKMALNVDVGQLLEELRIDHANSQKLICSEPSAIPEDGVIFIKTDVGNCNYVESDYDGCNIEVKDIFGDYRIHNDGSFRMSVLLWVAIKIDLFSSIECVKSSLCGSEKTCKNVISSDSDGQWMECNCR